jgi:hypothetical protein
MLPLYGSKLRACRVDPTEGGISAGSSLSDGHDLSVGVKEGRCGQVRTHCAPFLLDILAPVVVPQLKHSVSLQQPKITEAVGQREMSEAVWHRPGIDKRLEFLPCELCWVVVKELLVCR